MEQMTVTAKIQISVDTDSKVLLDETMSAYLDLFIRFYWMKPCLLIWICSM